MISSTVDARDRYDAHDYAGVVELLGHLSREELLADPAQAFLLANSARRVGGVEDLLEFVRQIAQVARERDATVLCEAINLEGALLFEQGHVRAAERAWCDLVEVATSVDQSQFVARASNNLGITAVLSMRLEEAIVSFQRAVNGYLRLGYARGLAQSNTNLGIVFREMDHEQNALASFERALTYGYTAEAIEDVARAEEELALYYLYICKDTSTAHTLAQQALERFNELRQPGGIAQASRVAGVVALAEHQDAAADELLNRALASARSNQIQLLQGETLLALAVLAERRRARPERFTLQEQARAVFAAVSAQPWGEQVARRMEQLVA
jgi:tetratricopeptide (TPR) repeat protein